MRCRHKVSLSRELLIHHYRGPPSPTGEGFFISLKLKKLRRNSSAKSNLKTNAGTPANPAQIQILGDQFTPRVILSGGRPQVGIYNRRAHRLILPTSATVNQSGNCILNPCSKSFEGGPGETFLQKSFPRYYLTPETRCGGSRGPDRRCQAR